MNAINKDFFSNLCIKMLFKQYRIKSHKDINIIFLIYKTEIRNFLQYFIKMRYFFDISL